jgi:hypothetical protein
VTKFTPRLQSSPLGVKVAPRGDIKKLLLSTALINNVRTFLKIDTFVCMYSVDEEL